MHRQRLSVLFLAVALAAASPGFGQDEREPTEFDRQPVDCVSMQQIQNTEIVDDRTILFYRRNGEIYMNLLESRCPTLKRNDIFRYRVNSGVRLARLCDYDAITVVDRLTNSLTYTCRLGPFHPIEAARAAQLLQAPVQTVTVEPGELPDEETGDAAE